MGHSEAFQRLIIRLGALIFRLWFATCRIKIVGRDIHRRYILEPASIVGATWHRNAIFLVWFFRRQHPLIMFSRSRDGELLAGFAAKLGVIPVRGSSSRGGREALAQMRERLLAPPPAKAATVMRTTAVLQDMMLRGPPLPHGACGVPRRGTPSLRGVRNRMGHSVPTQSPDLLRARRCPPPRASSSRQAGPPRMGGETPSIN